MEHKLVLGALGLGALGWLCLSFLLLPRPIAASPIAARPGPAPEEASGARREFVRREFVASAFLLPILVWGASLPTSAPFSAGQGWGRGFLLGGSLAFLTVWVLSRAISASHFSARGAAALSLCAALIAASVPLGWMRGAVIEALLGAATGWIAVSLLWLAGIQASPGETTQSETPQSERAELSVLITQGGAFATALFSAVALGVYRDFVFPAVARGTHPAAIVTLAAGVALAFVVGALVEAMAQNGRAVSSLFGFALSLLIPLGIGFYLATRVLNDLSVLGAILVGLAMGGFWWILARDDMARDDVARDDAARNSARVPGAALILALSGFMVAFQMLQGFGVGLMLLGAWPWTILALPARGQSGQEKQNAFEMAQKLSILGAFVAITLIWRVFATRFRADLRGASLEDQFALFGFVAGAVVPTLLASLWLETRATSRAPWRLPTSLSPARLAGVGVVALLLLGAMLTLWGVKVGPAFLLGLALASVGFHPQLHPRISSHNQASTIALWALFLSLTLAQWSQKFVPLAQVSRAARLQRLCWGVGGAIVLILVLDYGSRLISSRRNRDAGQVEVTP